MKAEKLSRFTYFRWVNFYWATLLDILHVCQQSTQSSYLSLISNYIRGEKNCHVEKLQLSIQNLNNLWSFIDVSAVFVLNLGRQKSGRRKSVWRKNDKYEVCVDTLLSQILSKSLFSDVNRIFEGIENLSSFIVSKAKLYQSNAQESKQESCEVTFYVGGIYFISHHIF